MDIARSKSLTCRSDVFLIMKVHQKYSAFGDRISAVTRPNRAGRGRLTLDASSYAVMSSRTSHKEELLLPESSFSASLKSEVYKGVSNKTHVPDLVGEAEEKHILSDRAITRESRSSFPNYALQKPDQQIQG